MFPPTRDKGFLKSVGRREAKAVPTGGNLDLLETARSPTDESGTHLGNNRSRRFDTDHQPPPGGGNWYPSEVKTADLGFGPHFATCWVETFAA